MAAVAAVTTTLKVGPGICLVVERDPITLAKEVASVDHLSGGRVLFGIGGGWNLEEMENHGTKPIVEQVHLRHILIKTNEVMDDATVRQKLTQMRERILAMKEIWTKDEAEFHGRHVNFDPIWSWPKPVQAPHPPVIVGGDGPRTLERVVEYGDGWMPIASRGGERLPARMAELRAMATAAGRGPIPVTLFGAAPSPELIEQWAELGVDRVLFPLPAAPAEETLPRLQQWAEVARRYAE
jgi:alkanesulfonate monooxygenase SsuD/methylene tetrahydromethanopterin reductase-like flavin-dependent oxidoreductase (luciferase family)